ncbi:MAG: hypothetical protein IKQ80_12120 [Clostridia bacterium]|nr:hypothetical protein [Clostridia bacterium]
MMTRSHRRIMLLLIFAALALALTAGALAEQKTVYTAKDGAKVYDAQGEVIGTLPADTKLTLTGVKGKVCRVERDGKTVYMMKSDLTQAAAPAATPAATSAPAKTVTAYAKRDGAKVYDAGGDTIATLKLNEAVTVTATKGKVCQVTSGGRTGYVRKADLSASPVATSASTAESAQPKSSTAYANHEGVKVYSAGGNVIATLKLNEAVTVTATKGSACRVTIGSKTGYVNLSDLSDSKTSEKSSTASSGSGLRPAKGTAKEMDWWTSDIQKIFARGVTAQITDVETGLTWRERRNGGTNHADCQPLTAADTAAMKKAYGGTWSWNRRAVFVTINGTNYAASINGMPHGSGSIKDNNFNGHHCIHFTNSRTHGTNKVCSLHQAAIKKAASTTLK